MLLFLVLRHCAQGGPGGRKKEVIILFFLARSFLQANNSAQLRRNNNERKGETFLPFPLPPPLPSSLTFSTGIFPALEHLPLPLPPSLLLSLRKKGGRRVPSRYTEGKKQKVQGRRGGGIIRLCEYRASERGRQSFESLLMPLQTFSFNFQTQQVLQKKRKQQ